MRSNYLNSTLKTAVLALTVLLLGASLSLAQSVDLTAAPTSATLPDGQVVPMWGYTCGAVTAPASCTPLNPNAGAGWSPVVITVPPGSLAINLTNNLSFTAGTGTNTVPTSLVIVGQLGGGLGGAPTRTPSPDHSNLPSNAETWPIVGTPGDFTPPAQGPRVQSFSTEVAAGVTTPLTWSALKPGTYLLESGTHPSIQGPMGLYGMLVVTTAPAGTTAGAAYPGVPYNADVPLLLSEIDAVQNRAVDSAVHTVGFTETMVWSGQPGGCGNPTSPTYNQCYPPAVNYDPRYYLVNGVAFDRSTANLGRSLFGMNPPNPTGSVLVRFVNAGLRMHVPSIVGSQYTVTGTTTASNGFGLIAEDGNPLPGVTRVQSEVFMAAGKTYDVMINAPASGAPAQPVFDRQLSLSTNNQRDGGMQAYIGLNSTSALPAAGLTAAANPDTYSVVVGNTLTVSDPAKGVIANDVGVYGVQVLGTVAGLTLNTDGTFTYTGAATTFTYCGNGATSGPLCTTVSLNACTGACLGSAPTANPDAYTSKIASKLQISPPGVLANDTDPQGHPLKASAATNIAGGTVTLNPDGSFTAAPTTAPVAPATATVTFQYNAVNSQNTSSALATVAVTFSGRSNLAVTVRDAKTPTTVISDYRWIIEEDRTFQIDPRCQWNTNPRPAGCPPLPVPSVATNFHSSYMPVVAAGCVGTTACESGQTVLDPTTGNHVNAVCDIGNGVCRPGAQQDPLNPSQVALDPTKRYYISVLPGDGADPFNGLDVGHTMGGAPIGPGQTSVTVLSEPTPLPTGNIAVFVFEDDFPLNGEADTGGGQDAFPTNEPGLGGFELTLFDQAGNLGDSTGQPTYDMFNMPLTNSLAGMTDPSTGLDACPISPTSTDHMVGMIVTCPKYEADGQTLSPLVGQAIIPNMYPGLYEVVATPGADRIARGEEWLQTNTLDGTKPLEAFVKPGEPAYFQEFGPAGFHVSIGFANPAIIQARKPFVCTGISCTNSITGHVTNTRISRTPDERLYSSGSYDAHSFTQCYASLGDPDGEDFDFTKCDGDGNFNFSGLPDGTWRITVFDQWNDILVDGLSTPIALGPSNRNATIEIPMQQWRTNVYTRTFFDQNGNGIPDRDANGNDLEPGLALVPINVRFRDGSFSNFNSTDLNGYAGFNEIFPYFHWLVLEADTTRYKQTGVHVVYDAGGPADGAGGGSSTIGAGLANTIESATAHLPTSPTDVRFPGSLYCANADCIGSRSHTLANPSTGRIDPPWVTTEAWQGFIGNAEFVEFGKKPFAVGENGGIKGHVIYASTRPFDDPSLLLQLSWEPGVPNVTINLYQEITAPDGTQTLKLVDHTTTASWDDWAQGFHLAADGVTQVPNMNCPGQETTSPFYFTLQNTTQWLNPTIPLPYNSRFKCYDGMAMFNQVQPAPYDGMYQFPSVTARDLATGRPTGTNCTICVPNPDLSDPFASGTPMLPAGKYVVEVVVPPGFELVKEEDKNILIGDNYIAPVTQQFAGLGSIFIIPDQAAVGSTYNPNNPQNPTTDLGVQPRHEGDTGSVESFWPCVGQARIVPDYISLFPQSTEVSPFAGATRNLCDRKEVTLEDQMSALAKFYIFTSTHTASHYTGIITDDFSSEFDPFSPAFGEKFAVPNLPISLKDFNGTEIARTYSDQWGFFNGLTYSTWEVNPPNPTGYGPTMMIACMNDPGNPTNPDPQYNPSYSHFCYEIPFMPGTTFHMDTPVVPTAAFAEGYNPPDCAYPNATPAIKTVTGDSSGGGAGPWVSAAGHTLTITALGDVTNVPNYAYSGPQATSAPFNQKFVTRHYGFGPRPSTCPSTGSCANATIAGVQLVNVSTWNDTTITGSVPSLTASQSTCTIQQRGVTATTRCGELVITAANGQQSIDTVTVTIGGKPPSYINGETPGCTTSGNGTPCNAIQTAINNATPGDLIIVGPGIYTEMLLMWKPVRLQGVGAASVQVNANPHPAGRLDTWRRQVACLFGLSLNGAYISPTNPFDPNGTFSCSSAMQSHADPIPLEPVLGWSPTLNGNISELLQEPTLLGAYEGAGITVLGKGFRNYNTATCNDTDPSGCILLTSSSADCTAFPSNFQCNPSRIDGMTFTNSSQGGGGIFLHGWNHNTEVANNRVYANAGTITGGIVVGQTETPDGTLDALGITELAFGFNQNVNVHNNSITQNASYGDEINSTTPASAGGATFCTGSDSYRFKFNWVCGNLSSGDGGGFAHHGFSYNGNISNNAFLFNQSQNPTMTTNGGGLAILGTPPDGPVCEGSPVDVDCPPQLSDGIGPGLVIDANLIVGNTAESGSGGGMRLQNVNGTEVGRARLIPLLWYGVSATNNIIANNVAGWDGGGVSLQDALRVSFVNNTLVSNDTTASAGVLFNTELSRNSNNPPPGCDPTLPPSSTNCAPITFSANQPAGLVTMRNTPNLVASIASQTVICPPAFPYSSSNCKQVSLPLLYNDLFWQNRAFHITVGSFGSGLLSQQNVVTLAPTLNQTFEGQCPTGASYWDIGVRGDLSATTHESTFTLSPHNSILTSLSGGYTGNGNLAPSSAGLVRQYCNGSRVPPENGGAGYAVPPGIADAQVPNPVFNLTPAATVDEGNNWINMAYGPLSQSSLTGAALGNYSITGSSAALNSGCLLLDLVCAVVRPNHDFFNNPRPQLGRYDIGAVELGAPPAAAVANVTPTSATFGAVVVGTTSPAQTLTLSNTGTAAVTGISLAFSSPRFSRPAGTAGGTCGVTLTGGNSCTINVVFMPNALGTVTGNLTITASVPVNGSPVFLSGTGN